MKTLFALSLLALAGCGMLPASMNYNGMDANTVREAVKDKNAGVSCTQFTGTGGAFANLNINSDKGVIANGSVTVKCGSAEATFTDSKAVK